MDSHTTNKKESKSGAHSGVWMGKSEYKLELFFKWEWERKRESEIKKAVLLIANGDPFLSAIYFNDKAIKYGILMIKSFSTK